MRTAALLLFSSVLAAPAWADVAAEASRVEAMLAEELQFAHLAHLAPRCSDEVFLRRVYLDLIGRNPAPDDVLAFLDDQRPDKRAQVVQRLLADERYGRNWAGYWRDVVMFRRTEERSLIAASALTGYLAEQLNANTPWDELATSFITATGDVQENGAAGLIMAHGGRPEETVSEISRIFLGIQIQRAQCHDHPTDRWRREQFHQLAAFFPRVSVRPQMEDGKRSFQVVASDRPAFRQRANANNRFRGTLEHRMPDLNHPEAPGEVIAPVFFVSGDRLALGTSDADRRQALAAWITSVNNPCT